ncbi:hypothetical protein [Staphylococcus aureus]|uniref:hypothetical protein n=1 Tax=Staphylococcus aureus TaxID=1280 RepID=UPI001617308B|nr:hypothetical protein [Staphylococcus aureus]
MVAQSSKFSDGHSITIPKGQDGHSVTVKESHKDKDGNTVVTFSDGNTITIEKRPRR